MNIIEVRPSKKFNGAWVAFEAPGVEPAFAANELHSGAGEVHVFGDDNASIERSIIIDGRGQYSQVGSD